MNSTVIGNQQYAGWSGAVVRAAWSSRPEYVVEYLELAYFCNSCKFPFSSEKVGLIIDFFYAINVLQFPYNPNITSKLILMTNTAAWEIIIHINSIQVSFSAGVVSQFRIVFLLAAFTRPISSNK